MSSDRLWQHRIGHILDSFERILTYTAGMTKRSLEKNQMAVDAVIRNFQVIGEAAKHVPKPIRNRYPEIPWSMMQGMRHIVVHDYDQIDMNRVWQTIKDDLPPLLGPLRTILVENPLPNDET
ncbi:MAG TPA: DUF86 domain-containing protein [Gemmataceae bacterium]|jgi:uncharacterized protein with HEPN domain|nr:DUF86 domain-containing protein [Gemmataceae bacterium]